MTQTYTTRDGVEHPIRDDHLIYPPGWTQEAEDAALVAWRANVELNPVDRQYLDAWTNRENLERAWAWLDGDYRDHGFETLCQVHGQAWSPDVCEGTHKGEGCVVPQVFDHQLRHGGEGLVVHAHRSHVTCARHSTITFKDHHHHQEHLLGEVRHKEAVLHAITERNGLKPDQRPKWRYTGNHELEIDTSGHPHLTPRHVRDVLREDFSGHVVHVI